MTNIQGQKHKSSGDQPQNSRRNFLLGAVALGGAASFSGFLSGCQAEKTSELEYDYIVVGAGSAGCTVAARLGERNVGRILVLEAGPVDTDQNIHIPAAFPALFKTKYDWNYESTPQSGLNGRRLYLPRGKVFGGCSSINAMIYLRGHPATYDAWGANNKGWTYDDVLPLFRRSEGNSKGASEHHGALGPLNVNDLRDPNPLTTTMVKAAEEAGFAQNSDFNDGEQEGFGQFQVTQKDGHRSSAATAFLNPALETKSIIGQAEALVTRLLVKGKRVLGVRFEANGEVYDVFAKKEVILCGGAFNSPHLLMLSGIGEKEQLEKFGIEVAKNLPGVGKNLQDHFMVPVAHSCLEPVSLAHAGEPSQSALYAKGMGMLTSNIAEGGGFVKLNSSDEIPNLQFHFGPSFFLKDGMFTPKGDGYTLLPSIVQPKSRGEVRLASADPHEKPLVDTGIFSHEDDIDIAVKGIKIARKIHASKAFDQYRGEELFPGKHIQSQADLKKYIREYIQTIYHPVGTCKMGSDHMAVVDEKLKVHGFDNLRVADASIMPSIINANTNAACFMIGEKCADLIKKA